MPDSMQGSHTPIRITGNGNCFYNAISMALFGSEEYYPIIRFATVYALVTSKEYFDNYFDVIDGTLLKRILSARTDSLKEIEFYRQKYSENEQLYSWANIETEIGTCIA
jgi:hypothetical protein